MRKKMMICLLVMVIVMGSSAVYGQGNGFYSEIKSIVVPYFTHINFFTNLLEIEDGGRALIDVYLKASNGTNVSLEVQLQRYQNGDWNTIKTWAKSGGTSASIYETWYVSSGYYYRTVATAKVYQNGVLVEQDSDISGSVWW